MISCFFKIKLVKLNEDLLSYTFKLKYIVSSITSIIIKLQGYVCNLSKQINNVN